MRFSHFTTNIAFGLCLLLQGAWLTTSGQRITEDQVPPLIEAADSLRKLSQLEPALHFIQDALDFLEPQDTNSELLASAYLTQGRILLRTETCYRAETPLQEALKLYQKLKVADKTYQSMMRLAELKLVLEDYTEAIQLYFEAAQFARSEWGEMSYYVGLSYSYLARCYFLLGDYETSNQYITSSISIFNEVLSPDDPRLGEAYFRAGNMFWASGNTKQSQAAYMKSLEISLQDTSVKPGRIQELYNNIGSTYWEQENKEKALEYYRKAMEMEMELNPDAVPVWEAEWKGESFSAEEETMNYYFTTLEQRKRTYGQKHPGTAGCYLYIGNAFLNKGEARKAIGYFQQAIQSMIHQPLDTNIYKHPTEFGQINREELLLDAMIGKIQGFQDWYALTGEQQQLQAAFLACQATSKFIRQIRGGRKGDASQLIWSKKVAPFYAKSIDVAWELYEPSKEFHYLQQAFAWMEEGRSFALLQSLRKDQALTYTGIPKKVQEEEQSFKARLAEFHSYILAEENKGGEAKSSKLESLQQAKLSLEGEYHAFLNQLEKQYPKYFQLKYRVSVSEIQDIKDYLNKPDNPNGWLSFVEGERNMYGIFISNDSLSWQILGERTELTNAAQALYRMLVDISEVQKNPESSFRIFTETGYQLHQQLIHPFAHLLPERCIISPSGGVSYLPFEVLLTGAILPSFSREYQSLPYFLKTHTISYAYSATFFLELSQYRSSDRNLLHESYVGFAPDYSQSQSLSRDRLPALRFSKHEIQHSAQLFGGKAFLDQKASKERFILEAANSNILHLAMHAQVNDSAPENSFFAFPLTSDEKDPNLYVFQLFGLELNSDLVVLSACNTGTGKWIQGEGLMSLARGFSYAGCPSLVVSLWQVDDQATSDLITSFFQELSTHHQKDIAIRKAQLSYLERGDPAMAHPYYWAGWRMLGESQLNEGISSQTFRWILIGLGLIAMGIFLYYRRSLKRRASAL